MTELGLALKKKLSFVSSWEYVSKEFASQWAHLNSDPVNKQGETIWQTRSKDVQLLEVPAETGSFRIAFKNYREKRFFRYFMRPSLAAREARGFALVQKLGFPCVKVLAFGEHRSFVKLKEAFFITAFEEGTKTFYDLANDPDGHSLVLDLLRETIGRLGQLHAYGWSHGGAHPRNFLWKTDEAGKAYSIWIDLASLRKLSWGAKKWKYILTDLSDLTEAFKLSQEELDMLIAEYRRFHDIPVAYKVVEDDPRKASKACRADK